MPVPSSQVFMGNEAWENYGKRVTSNSYTSHVIQNEGQFLAVSMVPPHHRESASCGSFLPVHMNVSSPLMYHQVGVFSCESYTLNFWVLNWESHLFAIPRSNDRICKTSITANTEGVVFLQSKFFNGLKALRASKQRFGRKNLLS